jgi:spectinomycin phosphotransferase
MRSGNRLLLVDWDTAGLALPERDLWLAAGDDARAAGRYTELTGRRVSGAAMDLYRLRWSLDDIALFVRDFRAPHGQNEDTALMWDAITEEMGEIE